MKTKCAAVAIMALAIAATNAAAGQTPGGGTAAKAGPPARGAANPNRAKLRTPSDKFPTDFNDATVPGNASSKIRAAANRLHAAFAGNDAKAAAVLFTSDAVYEDMTLHTQVLGRLAIERYLGRSLDKLPAGTGSSIVHVVGGDMGGGFEWQTAPAYRTTVRRGITAIAIDPEGKVSRLTTVWDGAMLPLDEVKTLVALSIE